MAPVVDLDALESLPPPVAGYLRHVLHDGQPLPGRVELRQRGFLRTSTESVRWLPFDATQSVNLSMPAFRWDARVKLPAFLHIRVRDAYSGGRGSGRVSLLSFIPLGSDAGSREMNAGALHRYLAESAWYPTALLPSERLRWQPMDGLKALATLTDSGMSVSLEFRFNGGNELVGIYTPERWAKLGTTYRQLPWEGHFGDYVEMGGTLVPARGEVGWYVGGEWSAVWRGEVESARYSAELY
jgi:hypothetical protein